MLSDAIIDRNVHLSALVLSTEMPEAGGQGGALPPPDFGRSVNPISTRGDRLCPPITMAPPDFQTFLRPCTVDMQTSAKSQPISRPVNNLPILNAYVISIMFT